MPETWASSGVDLHLDRTGPRVRSGLEAQLREAVRSGRLAPGLRLPSSRSLAADLGVARNTVVDVYGQLVAEGWLVARQGSVTRVAGRAPVAEAGPAPADEPRQPRYDLRPGSPDVAAFPRSRWLAAARRALNSAPAEAFGAAPDARGRPELHQALAEYLSRARGVRVRPDRIVVCSGFTQGLGLICRVLHSRGATTLALEAYGLPDLRDIAAAHRLRTRPLPVDGSGAVLDGLGDVEAVLLTPAHQFPLGSVLAPGRRARAIEWAARTGGLLIEDDYDGEFRYDRQPVGAMQALAPEHVIYAGTASKSLAPGLRLGWLVVPGHLVEELTAAKALTDRHSSSFDQLTLAEFLTSGAYDRQVRRARLACRRRRDHLVAAVRRHVPQARVTGVAAGLHALLELPPGLDEDEIIARAAARHDLALHGLRPYSAASGPHRPALVIGYATPPEHAFTGAVARLIAALTGAGHGPE
ncbi:MAG TPA: PLP-dependent aminotransferase family protein [Streptosporangiaceae bacterium]|jgi:GntR family transcriptional regulator/MocR family aminotransferase